MLANDSEFFRTYFYSNGTDIDSVCNSKMSKTELDIEQYLLPLHKV